VSQPKRAPRGTPTILIGKADVERRRAREDDDESGTQAIQQLLEILERKRGI